MGTEKLASMQNDQLARLLNVDELEFSHDRAMYHEADEVTPHVIDGQTIWLDRHHHVMARWRIGGSWFNGLVPVRLREERHTRTIIPLIWKSESRYFVQDERKMLEALGGMIDESRKMIDSHPADSV